MVNTQQMGGTISQRNYCIFMRNPVAPQSIDLSIIIPVLEVKKQATPHTG